jgi:Protein of unknown function (DUF1365)
MEALLRAFFALPVVTLKIVAAIHWEALRLWLKGTRLVPRMMQVRTAPPIPPWLVPIGTAILSRRCLLSGASPNCGKALWFSEAGI